METLAKYVLGEEDFALKTEIVYYLSEKTGIFFDKSVLFKAEIARQFMEFMKLDVDKNLVLTACLLCNCKKGVDVQTIERVHTYALDGANYLSELGFGKKFCKICEEVNRYSNSNPRERESDILELVDQFGGMLLDRPERIGFKVEEALVLLEHRNMKDIYNRYLSIFIEYVTEIQKIEIQDIIKTTPLQRLVKLFNETANEKEFIRRIAYEYSPQVNEQFAKHRAEATSQFLENDDQNPNRSLFSEETTKKIMERIEKQEVLNNSGQ